MPLTAKASNGDSRQNSGPIIWIYYMSSTLLYTFFFSIQILYGQPDTISSPALPRAPFYHVLYCGDELSAWARTLTAAVH